jgi:hypothetical protein
MWRYNYIVNVSGNIVDAVEELGIDQQELQNKLNFTSPRKQQYTVFFYSIHYVTTDIYNVIISPHHVTVKINHMIVFYI